MASVGETLVKVAKAIKCDNYNVLQNNGSLAHQVVNHVHFHIIPKEADAGLGLRWLAGETDHSHLAQLATAYRSNIQ